MQAAGPSQSAPLPAADAASLVSIPTPTLFRALLHVLPGPPPETEPGGQAPGTAPRLQAHQAALGGGTPQVSPSLISCSGWELPSVQVTLPKPLPFPSQGAPLQAPKDSSCFNLTESCTWTLDTSSITEAEGPDETRQTRE